jgi:hypothetical protein
MEFILGEEPPNPLSVEIVLPREFNVSLRAEALYTRWDPILDKEEKPKTDDYVFTVISAAREITSGNPN